MKFLGIRDGHDCNLTYTDGTRVRYLKFERNYQIKHYNWQHKSGDMMSEMLSYASKQFGFSFDEIDAIAMAADPAHHTLNRPLQINELFFEVDKSKNPFWAQFRAPVFQLDHHYSHIFSVWPLTDVSKVKTHFVFDGLGDHARVSGVFKTQANGSHKLVDYVDRMENLGLSVTMERIGQDYGMHGSVLDMSGKLMALKSYHNVPDAVTHQVMSIVEPLRYRHLSQFINVIEQVQNQIHPGLEDKQKLINLAYFLHVFGEIKLPEYFAQYADPCDVITYSGGTAQNTVVNTKIREMFPNVEIPPHCPDDGISLGCVEFLRQRFDQPLFDRSNFPFWQSDVAPESRPSSATINKTAELLAQGKIVGWYQGHGEIGPRALGNRSILMNPAIKGGKDIINAKVKHREPYRPFGASILAEDTSRFFKCDFPSPYMLYVIECLHPEDFASIVHVDGSCRIQTVDETPQYADYRALIHAFKERTGIPMVLNTSLNVDGKPIAAHPEDATTLFTTSDMDAVVIGDELVVK